MEHENKLTLSVDDVGSIKIKGTKEFVSKVTDAVMAIVLEESVKKVMESEHCTREVALQMHWDRHLEVSAELGMEPVSRIPPLTSPGPEEITSITALGNVTREEASRQGEWAYSYGYDANQNPYEADTEPHAAWADGWTVAKNEQPTF